MLRIFFINVIIKETATTDITSMVKIHDIISGMKNFVNIIILFLSCFQSATMQKEITKAKKVLHPNSRKIVAIVKKTKK